MKVKFLGLPGIETFTEAGKKYGIGSVVDVSDKRGKYMLETYPDGFEEVGAEAPETSEKSEPPEANKSMQTEGDK